MAPTERFLTYGRVLAFAMGIQVALAQKCYYPDGREAAPEEKPCSSAEGAACCPEKWECLSNGMCHYPPNNIYGRYSCTDKSWQADGCPSNLCTYELKGYGAENMQQCSNHDDQWCCNANNQDVQCCREWPEPRPFFDLPSGSAYATIGARSASQVPNLKTITGIATSGGGSAPSATSPPESSSNRGRSSNSASATKDNESPSPTEPTTAITSFETRVSSGSSGIITSILTFVTQPPASSTGSPNPTDSDSSSPSKVPLIVGLAVGIPLGLALLGILIWLFRKKHRQNKTSPPKGSSSSTTSPNPYDGTDGGGDFAGGAKLHNTNHNSTYKSETNIPELAGQSVGPARPVSSIPGKSELDSGTGFVPGTVAHAPHLVGVGGGNGGHTPQSSWGSAPPGYSPLVNQSAWRPSTGAGVPEGIAEADGTAVMGNRAEADGSSGVGNRVEADGTAVEYIPYRPPQGQQHGPSELSAVRTPPE